MNALRRLLPVLAISLASPLAFAAGTTEPTTMTHPVYELRQYTLHPGKRDVLAALKREAEAHA